MARRGFREDTIYFDHSGDCRDARHHKGCPGRWRAEVSLGHGADGKRIRPKVSGRTKQEVKDKLGKLHRDLEVGIRRPDSRYTVAQAVADWLHEGFDGRAKKTVTLNRDLLQPVVASIGKVVLRELTTRDVRYVLAGIAAMRSSRTVVLTHNALERAIRHAEANDYVRRNVAALVKPPNWSAGTAIEITHGGSSSGGAGHCGWVATGRLCRAVPARRGPHRGSQGTDMGSRRSRRGPDRRSSGSATCGRVAVGSGPR